jgi:acyl transferase domain-containing protein
MLGGIYKWLKLDPRRKRGMAVKRAKKVAAKKRPAVKAKVNPMRDWAPPPLADKLTNLQATTPKGPLSDSMHKLLYGEPQVIIVKAPSKSITNKQEFTDEMKALNVKVVYLDYTPGYGLMPSIEHHIQRKAE